MGRIRKMVTDHRDLGTDSQDIRAESATWWQTPKDLMTDSQDIGAESAIR